MQKVFFSLEWPQSDYITNFKHIKIQFLQLDNFLFYNDFPIVFLCKKVYIENFVSKTKKAIFWRAEMKEGGFSIFDSYDMKSLWFRFSHDIFTFYLLMACPQSSFFIHFMKWIWRPLNLKSWPFEAIEDIATKSKSQALHIIRIKLKLTGIGNPPSLPPSGT